MIAKDSLQEIVTNSKNKKECFIKLELHSKSNNSYKVINYYIKLYDIDVSHFKAYGNAAIKYNLDNKIPIKDILDGNHPLYTTSKLRTRLLQEQIFQHRCSVCWNTEWLNKPIPLDLDHINGIPTDHSIENLRMICRNCHAQTSNFCGKNHSKKRAKTRLNNTERANYIKSITDQKYEQFIPLIIESDIDFSKFGWVNKVAKIIKLSPQKVNGWMKRMMPDFYESKCFKRKIPSL